MPDIDSASGYLAAARRDAQALAHMLDEQAFPLEIFGFHVQQAMEKGLKGWLCLRAVATRWSTASDEGRGLFFKRKPVPSGF